MEIGKLRSDSLFLRIFFRKDIEFDRVGVHLPRLDFQSNSSSKSISKERPLIYLGRVTKWKGYDKFCLMVDDLFPEDDVIVFTSPAIHSDVFDKNFFQKRNRQIIYSESIAMFKWENSAIHFYPTFYTKGTNFSMSISFNVLESLYLGTPSIISKENFESWPELKNSVLCHTTTWDSEEVREIVLKIKSL